MRTPLFIAALCAALLANSTQISADAAAGEKLFGQCQACHQIGESAKHLFGPTLNGVLNRTAASTEGYAYSPALSTAAEAGLTWDDTSMDEFLAAPMQYVAGTKMAFPGVADENHRADLIAYLKQFDQSGAVLGKAVVVEEAPVVEDEIEERKLATEFDIPTHGVLHLGRTALDDEIIAWDIDVRPDGLGLPLGSGNAIDGAELYDSNCASCHGDFGEGADRWPILAGGQDSLTADRPEKTIGSYWPYLSTVYDYIRRAMPFGNARSLSDDDVYAITAYLLYLNDLEDEDFELTSENFASIRLPNEGNFISDNRSEEPYRKVKPDDLCMTNCIGSPAQVTQRARVLDVTPDEL